MLYDAVVQASSRVAATPRRTEKVALLSTLLRACSPDDVLTVVGMLLGEPRQGRLGVGWASADALRVAPAPSSAVTVAEIDGLLDRLAGLGGAGSQRERHGLLARLGARLTADEQTHLIRFLLGEMRQGANAGVVTDAVAKAAGVPVATVRRAAMLLGDLGVTARRALAGDALDVGLTPLVAVQPMLAATSGSVAEALAATGPASVEWKLDGIRVQAHKSGEDVRVFSRGLNDITPALPRLVDLLRSLPARDVVLDGESLGLDESGRPQRFQDTMSGLGASSAFFFDVLHVDGDSLIDRPLRERKRLLADVVPAGALLPSIETDDGELADRFAEAAVGAGQEGVMVKSLDSPYSAGRRGVTWRKVKPVHTLDLVVLAAEWGHGRRQGWLSNLHLGAQEGEDGAGFVMVGKTFKGMTDEMLRWQTEQLRALSIATEDGYVVHVRPELIVEVAVDGVQVSRRYPGGVALRFARVRRYRTDKTVGRPGAVDTIDRVRALLG